MLTISFLSNPPEILQKAGHTVVYTLKASVDDGSKEPLDMQAERSFYVRPIADEPHVDSRAPPRSRTLHTARSQRCPGRKNEHTPSFNRGQRSRMSF